MSGIGLGADGIGLFGRWRHTSGFMVEGSQFRVYGFGFMV